MELVGVQSSSVTTRSMFMALDHKGEVLRVKSTVLEMVFPYTATLTCFSPVSLWLYLLVEGLS